MAEFQVHPIIEKLIAATRGSEGVVELLGFIGPRSEGDAENTLPLYTSLDLSERVLVPIDAIVHVQEPDGDGKSVEPTRVFVRSSTEVRVVNVTTAGVHEVAQVRARYVRKTSVVGGGYLGCKDNLMEDLEKYPGDPAWIVFCIDNYIKCMQMVKDRGIFG
jgi:hypothetical protein